MFQLSQKYSAILNADCVVTTALLDGCSVDRLWSGVDLNGKRFVFFPCNLSGDHWMLFVADLSQHIIMFLNPLGSIPGWREVKLFDLIAKLMNKVLNIQPVLWNWNVPPYSKQKDSVNCGIYVMWYAEQLATGKSLTESVIPDVFRHHVFLEITGSCMRRRCYSDQTCGVCNDDKPVGDCLQCNQCDQWYHCACVGTTLDNAVRSEFQFLCPFRSSEC